MSSNLNFIFCFTWGHLISGYNLSTDIQGISSMKSIIPLNLRMRAATATALGAAAANAKLLADQEDREIEHLVATMIEAQVTFPIPHMMIQF